MLLFDVIATLLKEITNNHVESKSVTFMKKFSRFLTQ